MAWSSDSGVISSSIKSERPRISKIQNVRVHQALLLASLYIAGINFELLNNNSEGAGSASRGQRNWAVQSVSGPPKICGVIEIELTGIHARAPLPGGCISIVAIIDAAPGPGVGQAIHSELNRCRIDGVESNAGCAIGQQLDEIGQYHTRQVSVRNRLWLISRESQTDKWEVCLAHVHLDIAIPEPAAMRIVIGNGMANRGKRYERLVRQFIRVNSVPTATALMKCSGRGMACVGGGAADQMGSMPHCVT